MMIRDTNRINTRYKTVFTLVIPSKSCSATQLPAHYADSHRMLEVMQCNAASPVIKKRRTHIITKELRMEIQSSCDA